MISREESIESAKSTRKKKRRRLDSSRPEDIDFSKLMTNMPTTRPSFLTEMKIFTRMIRSTTILSMSLIHR